MSFFCIVAWEWRVPGGVDGWTWLVECPVCLCVCVCQASSLSIHSPGRTDFFLTLALHPDTHTLMLWKRWHTTSHLPASRLVPNNLSPSLRDCLCVLWLFTVKWPLVLLMASYVVIILPLWNRQKVIVFWYSRSLGDRIHSDYFHAHLEVVSEHYRHIFPQNNLWLLLYIYIYI